MTKQYCLFSIDVETHSIFYNSLRDETGELVLKEGLPLILNLFAKYDSKTTFFFTGYMAEKFPESVKLVAEYGHEIGCHGYSHRPEHGFDVMNLNDQIEHLTRSKKILEEINEEKVVSFRSPALRISNNTATALYEAGFKYDSSVAPQRFDMFLSFGGIKKLKWLFAPRLPYRTQPNNIFKKGNGPIVEIPISAFLLPYIGTTLRIFPNVIKLLRYYLFLESKISRKPIVFDIHPNEFLEEGDGKKKRDIERRSRIFITYLLSDFVRGKMKIKNLGIDAFPLFERELSFFINRGFKFCSIREYGELQGKNL